MIAVPEVRDNVLTLDLLGAPAFQLAVHGDPAPQGSKDASVRNGRAFLFEASKRVTPWRRAVRDAVIEAVDVDWQPLDGPLVVDMIVTLPRPKSLPKTLRRVPSPVPDLSKLLRATEDALVERPKVPCPTCKVKVGVTYEGDGLWKARPHAQKRVPCPVSGTVFPAPPRLAPRLKPAALHDDARIVSFRRLDKVYADDTFDSDALEVPGVVFRAWDYPAALLGKMGAVA